MAELFSNLYDVMHDIERENPVKVDLLPLNTSSSSMCYESDQQPLHSLTTSSTREIKMSESITNDDLNAQITDLKKNYIQRLIMEMKYSDKTCINTIVEVTDAEIVSYMQFRESMLYTLKHYGFCYKNSDKSTFSVQFIESNIVNATIQMVKITRAQVHSVLFPEPNILEVNEDAINKVRNKSSKPYFIDQRTNTLSLDELTTYYKKLFQDNYMQTIGMFHMWQGNCDDFYIELLNQAIFHVSKGIEENVKNHIKIVCDGDLLRRGIDHMPQILTSKILNSYIDFPVKLNFQTKKLTLSYFGLPIDIANLIF